MRRPFNIYVLVTIIVQIKKAHAMALLQVAHPGRFGYVNKRFPCLVSNNLLGINDDTGDCRIKYIPGNHHCQHTKLAPMAYTIRVTRFRPKHR